MRTKWFAPAALAATALVGAACSSSSTTAAAPATAQTGAGALQTATVSGTSVLTSAAGFTLYWFAPDTATTSHCTGSCAQIWPPVKGPAAEGQGVTGKLGTITRSDGSTQATYDGHPLYTYAADTAPGQANGNGINANGGVWHEMTASGATASAAGPSAGSSGVGGY
jgi:predicted lipoprotein with Yx(FWY)xxD motif